MDRIIKTDSHIIMTTVDIAELTGKHHKHVMRDTKNMLLVIHVDLEDSGTGVNNISRS